MPDERGMAFGIPVYDEEGRFMYYEMPPGTNARDERHILSPEEAGDFDPDPNAPVSIPPVTVQAAAQVAKDRSMPVDVTRFTQNRVQLPPTTISEDVALPPPPPRTGPASKEELEAIASDPELLRQTKMYPDEPGKGREVALQNLRARNTAPAEGVSFGGQAPAEAGQQMPDDASSQQETARNVVIGAGIDELDKLIGRGTAGRTVNQTTKTTTVQRQQQLETPESLAAEADAELAREQLKDRIATEGQIAQDKGEATAMVVNAFGERLEEQNVQDQQRRAQYESRLQGLFQQQELAMEDFRKQAASFDTNRLMGKGSANSMVFAIAAGLGAVSATKTGVNHAVNAINKAIERDIHEQETKLKAGQVAMEASGQLFDRMRGLYGDTEAAAAATRAGMYEAASLKVRAMQEQYGGEASAAAGETLMAQLDLKAAEAKEQAAKAAAGIVMEQSVTKPVRIGGTDPLKRAERIAKLMGVHLDNAAKQGALSAGPDGTPFTDAAKNRMKQVAFELANVRAARTNIEHMRKLNNKGTGAFTGGGFENPLTVLSRAGGSRMFPTDAANRTQEIMALGESTAMRLAAKEQGKQVSDTERKAILKRLAGGAFDSDSDRERAYQRELKEIDHREAMLLQSLTDPNERAAVEATTNRMRQMEAFIHLNKDPALTPVQPK